MSAEQTTSLVQRKARTGSDAHAARAMSLGRALRLTAAKQADLLMGLALGALSVTQKTLPVEKLPKLLEQEALMLLMDGPGGQVATALLEPTLFMGMIQQQTMGKVTAAPEQENNRPSTATDAALCAPYIEALLSQAAKLPEKQSERDLLKGYRFGVWASTPRQVTLALEAPCYEMVEMTLDLAAGTRAGKLVLLLPEPSLVRQEVADSDEGEAPQPIPSVTLDKHVMELHADLSVALTRLKMPLQEVSQMKVGDVLDLDMSSMEQALVIDKSGRALTRGTLGQIDGVRALQVEQKKDKLQDEPRRRASDREELDLPDVTAPLMDFNAEPEVPDMAAAVDLPSMSDVDIFGDIDDLADMPDMDMLAAEADAQMDALGGGDEDANAFEPSQVG